MAKKKGRRAKWQQVMCPRCKINRRWRGGYCPVCREATGRPPPGEAVRSKGKGLNYTGRAEVLSRLGFSDYATYLGSSLWAEIRERVFAAQGEACWVCRRKKSARQVHHDHYTEANLSGRSIGGLHPTCPTCHHEIEFTADGKKRKADDVARRARSLRTQRKWYKSVLKQEAAARRARREQAARENEFRERLRRD